MDIIRLFHNSFSAQTQPHQTANGTPASNTDNHTVDQASRIHYPHAYHNDMRSTATTHQPSPVFGAWQRCANTIFAPSHGANRASTIAEFQRNDWHSTNSMHPATWARAQAPWLNEHRNNLQTPYIRLSNDTRNDNASLATLLARVNAANLRSGSDTAHNIAPVAPRENFSQLARTGRENQEDSDASLARPPLPFNPLLGLVPLSTYLELLNSQSNVPALSLANTTPLMQFLNVTPPRQQSPLIRDFLTKHGDTVFARLIYQLTTFARDKLTEESQQDAFSDRLQRIITHYNNHPHAREGFENVAIASTENCRDGALGGLLAIEKHLATIKLVEAVQEHALDAQALYEAAKQHYAQACVQSKALEICSALGSTHEAIEVELLLIKYLGHTLNLPIQNTQMQNLPYATIIFNNSTGLRRADTQGTNTIEKRMANLADEIHLLVSNKANVIEFMSNWPPAQSYVDQSEIGEKVGKENQQMTQTILEHAYAHVETVLALAQKDSLSNEDRAAFGKVLAFLRDYKPCIPVKLYERVQQLSTNPITKNEVTDAIANDCCQAIAAVRNNTQRATYLKALKIIYDQPQKNPPKSRFFRAWLQVFGR